MLAGTDSEGVLVKTVESSDPCNAEIGCVSPPGTCLPLWTAAPCSAHLQSQVRQLHVPKTVALFATFACSGLLHVYPILLSLHSCGESCSVREAWMMMAFFMLQAVLLEVERTFHLSGTAWTIGSLLLTGPIFTIPFVRSMGLV